MLSLVLILLLGSGGNGSVGGRWWCVSVVVLWRDVALLCGVGVGGGEDSGFGMFSMVVVGVHGGDDVGVLLVVVTNDLLIVTNKLVEV